MFISRQFKQSHPQKLSKSRQFYVNDIHKTNDNRILQVPTLMNKYKEEYYKLTASKYDYMHPDTIERLKAEEAAIFENLEKEPSPENENINTKFTQNESSISPKFDENSENNFLQKQDDKQLEITDEIKPNILERVGTGIVSIVQSIQYKLNTIDPKPKHVDRCQDQLTEQSCKTLSNENNHLITDKSVSTSIQTFYKMDKVFKEHGAGWHRDRITNTSNYMEDLPELETQNYDKEHLNISGHNYYMDTTCRKQPTGSYTIDYRDNWFPHWRTKFSAMDYKQHYYDTILWFHIDVLGSRPRLRMVDRILYYNKFPQRIDSQIIYEKMRVQTPKHRDEVEVNSHWDKDFKIPGYEELAWFLLRLFGIFCIFYFFADDLTEWRLDRMYEKTKRIRMDFVSKEDEDE